MLRKSIRSIAYIATIIVICGTVHVTFPLIVGSNTVVSRQGLTTFPAADTDNQMLGFVFMENGYTLQDFTTSCSYNAFFPVGNTIQMNGGTLFLTRALPVESQVRILSPGSFLGGGNSLVLTTTNPALIPEGGLNAFRQQASLTAATAVNTLDWTYDSNYIIYATTASSNNLTATQFTGNALSSLVTANVGAVVNSVRGHPTTNYFGLGVTGAVAIPGVQVWQFNPNANTLTQISTDAGTNSQTVASVAWHPSGDFLAIAKNVGNGQLAVYPFNKTTGALGTPSVTTLGTAATFPVRSSIDWSPDGNYLIAGVSNNAATELQMYLFDGTSLTFTLGSNIGQQVNTVSWSPTGSFIATGLNGSTTRLRVYRHTVQSGTLTLATSVSESTNGLSVEWRADGNVLAFGRASGTGTEFRLYTFNKTTPALTLAQSVERGTNINDVRWSPDSKFIATAGSNRTVVVYRYANGTSLSQDPVIFNNIVVSFNADVLFRTPVLIQGNCVINGNNNNMAFDTSSLLIVDAGASLLCESLTMTTMSTSKLRMVDSLSSLTLRDVNIYFDNDLTITQGFLTFQNNVSLFGNVVFGLQSAQQATIASNAYLYIDEGMTFSYAPPTSSRTLFGFQDQTSILHLNNVSILSTTTGLQLTKGIVEIEAECRVQSSAISPAEGILLGDGITSANDVTVRVLPESGLNIISGYLVYNNVN